MLIAIEGIDGAGKGTVAAGLHRHLQSAGRESSLVSFPQYGATAAGRVIGRLLGDGSGDIKSMSVEALATLFAEDRRQARNLVIGHSDSNTIICDRFTASNAAFQCGRLEPSRHSDFIRWLEDLEFNRFGTPRPDLNILLNVPVSVSRELVARKAVRSYTEATHDANEADTVLQERAAAAYRLMAETGAMGGWHVIDVAPDGHLKSINQVLAEAIAAVEARLPSGTVAEQVAEVTRG